MKYILSLIIGGALVVSGFGQTRNVLVGTNNAVVQPTNFWSADASNARTGLGLGTAATSSISAFQPASSALSNLATSNGGALSNLQATNLVGIIPASNISSITFTNVSGTLAINSGGTGATNASTARTNLGATTVGSAVFTAIDTTAARTALALGSAAISSSTDFQPADSDLTNLAANNAINLTNFPALLLRTNGNGSSLTNLTAANISGTIALASNVSGVVAITNGGTGATNTETARTNLGLGWSALTNTDATNFRNTIGLGATWLTNTNVTNFRSAIGLGTNAQPVFDGLTILADLFAGSLEVAAGLNGTTVASDGIQFTGISAATTRTNLGLPWSGLTNTNAATFQASLFGSNTNPVLVNTNGEVVSPTNFWAVAPISTTVQYQTNVTGTSTNTATNSRNLFLFSLSPSVSGITNTVTLPTNPATTFEGDRATITHLAQTTNAVTAIRQLGAATNLITLNQLDEAVLLMYRSGAWILADNISYIEPIFFSGTNAAANAAASRTNLGLGLSLLTNTTRSSFVGDLTLASVAFATNEITFYRPIIFGADSASNAATSRTNLGIPLPALTNTNNANFQAAVFATNSNPTNAGNFNNHVAWMDVTIQTNGSNVSFRVPLYK